MSSKFLKLTLLDGAKIVVNTTYITEISPTHGNDFENGVDVIFKSFGENDLLKASVPASQVQTIIDAVNDSTLPFIEIKTANAPRVIINQDYISHIEPTHGNDYTDGVTLNIWGTTVQVPASGTSAISKLWSK